VDRQPDLGMDRMRPDGDRRRPADPYLPGHGDPGHRVLHYHLELDYRVAGNRLAGEATLTVETLDEVGSLTLDLAGLRVAAVLLDGRRTTRYTHRDRRLVIRLDRPAPRGRRITVQVRYSGSPRPLRGRWGEVGWEELDDGLLVAGQPNGAPTWFPCNDRVADKATYTLEVTCESPYTVLANGTLTRRRVHSSRTTWRYEQREPMAGYLASLQIGRYEVEQVGAASTGADLLLACPPRLRRLAGHDLGRQQQMMTAFERWFGPYPFERYTAVVTDDELEIPLEAQTLSVFGANHLDGRRGHERLVAHELAHQWFGNSLTVGSWRDIWLHEGFACYAEWLWSQDGGGPSADAIARRERARLAGQPQDLLLGDPGPDLMFDDRVYKRGALTLHAVRLTVGEEAFADLLRSWSDGHRHRTVTSAGFRQYAGERTGVDLEPLLSAWLDRRPLPSLPASSAGGDVRRAPA
jgi:aminopeptidase N